MAKKADIGPLLDHHRFYVTRNWQYFAALLLVNSITLNAYDTIKSESLLIGGVSISSLILFSVFYHFINWTNMRIDANMKRVNKAMKSDQTPFPKYWFDGLIGWMKLAIIVVAVPYILVVFQLKNIIAGVGILLFIALILISEVSVFRFKRRGRIDDK